MDNCLDFDLSDFCEKNTSTTAENLNRKCRVRDKPPVAKDKYKSIAKCYLRRG